MDAHVFSGQKRLKTSPPVHRRPRILQAFQEANGSQGPVDLLFQVHRLGSQVHRPRIALAGDGGLALGGGGLDGGLETLKSTGSFGCKALKSRGTCFGWWARWTWIGKHSPAEKTYNRPVNAGPHLLYPGLLAAARLHLRLCRPNRKRRADNRLRPGQDVTYPAARAWVTPLSGGRLVLARFPRDTLARLSEIGGISWAAKTAALPKSLSGS